MELLFSEESLDAQLRVRQQSVSSVVDQIAKDRFLASSDQEVNDYVTAKLRVDPLVLNEAASRMHPPQETQVDVSRDPNRTFGARRRTPLLIPGTQVDIDIPFTGDDWLFHYQTNPWSSASPRANIQRGFLRLTFTEPHDVDSSVFKTSFEKMTELIRTYVGYSFDQVVAYNDSLGDLVQRAVDARRKRLDRHGNISAMLDIPIKTDPDAPSISPVKLELRQPPRLAKPPKTGLTPEPGIKEEIFEYVLRCIRHQGRTFERTPSTYSVHGEEDLRNIVLAHLNGHFLGDAVGEAFRAKGKTDICIEQENRAAFVGECKIWSGPTGFAKALDQLLSYLTWRDSKAALILFNLKVKEFSGICEAIPTALSSHPLFLANLPFEEAGEWRVRMRSEEDEGRRVTVHVFAFNLRA